VNPVLLAGVAALLAGGTEPDAPHVVVFRHVNVVPMDSERVLRDQVVVVRDGEIVALGGEGKAEPPAGDVATIDGKGAFLLPGLADLHVHAQQPDDLFLYVANGVTTTLNLGLAWPSFVTQTRARIRSGELVAPQCFVAPMLNGPRGSDLPCATADEARAAVRTAKETGYEFIKVYNDLPRPLFHAVCEEAHALGLAVVGHGVREPGLAESFEAGQIMVAHAEEYLYTILKSGTANGVAGLGGPDESKVPEAVELTKKYGVYVVPNLSAYEAISAQWGKPEVVDAFLAKPQIRVMRPFWRRAWRASRYTANGGTLGRNLEFLRGFTKALHDGGVRLLAGTDSPDIPGVQAGFSIHDDLRNLVASGLSPFDAISCATRVAGEFVAECVPDAEAFGTVAVGQRADLLLVEKNPLEDVANLRDPGGVPIGVMIRGRWFTRDDLTKRLDAMAARFTEMEACENAFVAAGRKSGWAAACAGVDATKRTLDEEMLNDVGSQLQREGQRDQALAVLELATRMYPDSANAVDSLGDLLAALGRPDDARASYEKELALDPRSVRAKRSLAKAPAPPR
jgi:hypothetical protein